MRWIVALALLTAGCLNGDYNEADASVPADMALNLTFDLSNYDLSGLYNCAQLNACEQACMTKACSFMCRNMATPPAVAKDSALQSCFNQYCPTGTGGVCAPDSMGMLSAACMMCLKNTQLSPSASCSPTQVTSECGMCYSQAQICLNDQ